MRNRIVNDKLEKIARIFIKDTIPKVQKVLKEQEPLVVKIKDHKGKKWEAKKEVTVKKVEKKESSPTESTMLECKGTNPDLQFSAPIDMFSILSQMTIKVPLSQMFRIKEHKSKAIEWISGVRQHIDVVPRKVVDEKVKLIPRINEPECIIFQIPPRYLDSAMTSVVEDIDPFMLSLIASGITLKNCTIDSGASNTIMPFKVIEALGLEVDTK